MPWLRPATVDALSAARSRPTADLQIIAPRHRAAAAATRCCGAASSSPALETMSGDTGARALLRARPDALRLVDVDDSGVLRDVDTPAALPP
ncbi:MAG: hypothetical protein H6713_15805 [Myxococcales bacterium]|nr:hypothetical protein [Myxococcales bacterium]